jgi:hypothetical protein
MLDVLRPVRPAEQAAHRIEEVSRLMWCTSSPFPTALDGGFGYLCIWLITRSRNNALKDIIALPACCL